MTTAAITEKLHDFINTADDKKVEAMYTFVKGEITDDLKANKSLSQMEKIEAMTQAANDPLFLADVKEISDDFDHWQDEDFLKELKSRIDDIESGKDEGISWEEVKQKARDKSKRGSL